MQWIKRLLSVFRRIVCLLMLTLLLTTTLILKTGLQLARGDTTWTVDDDGSGDFRTIQEAINAAGEGDSIYVYNGTYHENLTITKPITLLGQSKKNTIVDGNKADNVIWVFANNVDISGFTIRNSSRQIGIPSAGVKVRGRENNITGNHITKTNIGVFVDSSQNNRIAGNSIEDNGQGISLSWSSEITVNANNFSGNTYGITLARSFQNRIFNNSIAKSSPGGHGIYLSNSFNNTIYNNDITDNYHGMWLSNSFDNLIIKNTIANNTLLGIELANSINNKFYNNKFANNPRQVKIGNQTDTNIWNDEYPSGGNYWSDYEERYPDAQELNGSGIYDTPYVINNNNIDHYPLIPEFPSSATVPLFMISAIIVTILTKKQAS